MPQETKNQNILPTDLKLIVAVYYDGLCLTPVDLCN